MCVLSRVLYGDLTRTSLDLSRSPLPETRVVKKEKPSSWLDSWSKPWSSSSRTTQHPPGTKLAYWKRVDHLVAPACTQLFPYEGNLHEFVAGRHGAAVLDILLPPYDADHHRDCNFYEIQESSSSRWEQQTENNTTSASDPVWLVPTGQPEDFHCVSGSYGNVGKTTAGE